jgi:hypothetical protein
MSSNVHDYPRFRAIRSLLLLLWDKAVHATGYDRREWESVMEAVEVLARKGLGLPSDLGAETPTPTQLRAVVVMGSSDGAAWTELGRFLAEAPILPILNIREHKFIKFHIETDPKMRSNNHRS